MPVAEGRMCCWCCVRQRNPFSKSFKKFQPTSISFDMHEKQLHMKFWAFFHILNTAPYDQNFQKWPFPLKIALLWHKVRFLFFELKKKVFTDNDFLKVGYYPRFYSSLRDKKWRNGDILKISCIFLNFGKFIKTRCQLEVAATRQNRWNLSLFIFFFFLFI